MNVLNAEQMRAADAHAIQTLNIPSSTLMENAATKVAEIILRRYPAGGRRALVICGKGNNGGDGMAVARLLKDSGWDPSVLLIANSNELKPDSAANWTRAISSNISCREDPDALQVDDSLQQCDLVIDALFGTGLTKPLTGIYSSTVQKINRSGKEVLAVDVPSGLNSDSGVLPGPAIKATSTVSLAALKFCHLQSPSSKMCGEIYVVDIGIPATSTTFVVRSQDVRRILPHRPLDSHKGTHGHAVVIGGSTGKSGAVYLAAKSALRCGAGLVTAACPSNIQSVIAGYGPEIMTLPVDDPAEMSLFLADKTTGAIGPGMGTESDAKRMLHSVLSEFQGPLVIDADALNLVATDLAILEQRKRSSTILTPHPGEMARLMSSDTETIQNDRVGMARKLAGTTGSIVVLKGYRTIVAHSDGRAWIVPTGGQALASGGTGDVLTGIITGLLSQRLKPLEAALAGVYLHGLTSNLFEQKYPHQAMNALDILERWNEALRLVRSGRDIESEYIKIHFAF